MRTKFFSYGLSGAAARSRLMRALLMTGLSALWPTPALGAALPSSAASAHQCERVEVSSKQAECDRDRCHLSDNVVLRCEKLTLWADTADVYMTPEQTFAGAVAYGHVLLVDDKTVMNCERLTLGPDSIQGRVEAATIRVKKPPLVLNQQGVPVGRDASVFRGEIERLDRERYRVFKGQFTMCDCGTKPPSWRFDSPKIEATLDERVLIWWPQLRLRPFGLATVPILPPMLPLSLPLKRRAAGFLPPRPQFFAMGIPTIDLPFFVPLGQSWDLTLTPGMRFDWGDHQTKSGLPLLNTWGAPRLGGRLRYAPTAHTSGEFNLQWTHDGHHWNAKNRQKKAAGALPLTTYNEDDPVWDLVDRISLDWKHHTKISEQFDWVANAEWHSDDLILQDFRIMPLDAVVDFVPSRTQLAWHRPGAGGYLAADYFLRLNARRSNGEPDLSNIHGAERDATHRGPYLEARLLPQRLIGPLHGDARATFTRYGPFVPDLPFKEMVGTLVGGLSYLDNFGPISLAGRAAWDAVWVQKPGQEANLNSIGLFSLEASTQAARGFGSFRHVVQPRVAVRTLPWSSMQQFDSLSYWTQRRTFSQVAVELQQSLWQAKQGSLRKWGTLVLSQPFDLQSGERLQTRAELNWSISHHLNGELWTGLDLSGARQGLDMVRELGSTLNVNLGPVSFGGLYSRWAPDSERFQRTVYELAGPNIRLTPETAAQAAANWVHSVRSWATLRWQQVFFFRYDTDYLLPLPGQKEGRPECRAGNSTGPVPKSCFVAHTISLTYRSPCDCWSVGLYAGKSALLPWRYGLTFEMAGYSIASTQNQ